MSGTDSRSHKSKAVSKQQSSQVERDSTDTVEKVAHPQYLVQNGQINPHLLSPSSVLQLQRVIGNKAISRILSRQSQRESDQSATVPVVSADGSTVEPLQTPIRSLPGSQYGMIQRVEINGTEINAETTYSIIVQTLGYNHMMGYFKTALTSGQIDELIKELKDRKDCSEMVEDLEAMVEDLEAEAELEEKGDGDSSASEEDESPELEEKDDWKTQFDPEYQKAKRREDAEKFGWEDFPAVSGDWKKIGVHETTAENAKTLVTSGPSEEKTGTGHGEGKGKGFYVTPVGLKKLITAIGAIEYGESYCAVYVSTDLKAIKSASSENDNIDFLDKQHGEEECYYIMSGGGEIVIPVRSFDKVKVVTEPDQLEEK